MKQLITIAFLTLTLVTAPGYALIKIGHPLYNPPFIINKMEGFDLDIMRKICQHMQTTCKFYPIPFEELFSALDQGIIDLAIGGITISKDRQANYIFSLPYLVSNGRFLVLKNTNLQLINHLQGKKIGTISGSDYEAFLTNHSNLHMQIIPYNRTILLVDALNRKEIDGIFLDWVSMSYWQKQGGGMLNQLEKDIPIGSGFAIMSNKNHASLMQLIDHILIQMEQDGSYLALYNAYFIN